MELGGWKTASMLYRYAINDEALLHRGSQRVCDYTVKLQETAEKKKKGEPAFFALPKWLAGALRSLSQAQRAEALDLMRSYGIEEERPDSP
jgi:hypothetical protein